MDSITLKGQKTKFINSVTQYNQTYQEIVKKINNINMLLEDSDDNLLYDFIRENNDKIIKKINELKSSIDKYKFSTLEKVNYKIALLEEQERASQENTKKSTNEIDCIN